jgi:hypothetical protein
VRVLASYLLLAKRRGKISLDRIFISAIIHLIKLSEIMICLPYRKFCPGADTGKFSATGQKKFDELVKSRNSLEFVIPAKAGIQLIQDVLDPGFRRGDASRDFLRVHQICPLTISLPGL